MQHGYIPPEDYSSMYTLCGEAKRVAEKDMFGGWDPDEGSDLSVGIVVQIVFDEENPNGYIYQLIYTGGSGRSYFWEDNEILPPELEDLWKYMYSY